MFSKRRRKKRILLYFYLFTIKKTQRKTFEEEFLRKFDDRFILYNEKSNYFVLILMRIKSVEI